MTSTTGVIVRENVRSDDYISYDLRVKGDGWYRVTVTKQKRANFKSRRHVWQPAQVNWGAYGSVAPKKAAAYAALIEAACKKAVELDKEVSNG